MDPSATAEGQKRCKKPRVMENYVCGESCAEILRLVATFVPTRTRSVFPAVCITAARIRASSGEISSEQSISAAEKQELRQPKTVLGEKIEYYVRFKDNDVSPSWEPAENVGLPLIKQFQHLLHVYPSVEQKVFTG